MQNNMNLRGASSAITSYRLLELFNAGFLIGLHSHIHNTALALDSCSGVITAVIHGKTAIMRNISVVGIGRRWKWDLSGWMGTGLAGWRGDDFHPHAGLSTGTPDKNQRTLLERNLTVHICC